MSTFQAPKGTFDLMPPSSAAFLAVREAIARRCAGPATSTSRRPASRTPSSSPRGVGESTDIVTKEMYTFETQGGDSLTLRPEGTASVMRAVLEAQPPQGRAAGQALLQRLVLPLRAPQKGRYRHFSQVGAEAIGAEDPALDAELIILAAEAYRTWACARSGCCSTRSATRQCRPVYRAALQDFLRGLDLDEATRARIEINPLRVLDDKRADVQAQLVGAPLIGDYLCEACKAYHDEVRGLLTGAGRGLRGRPEARARPGLLHPHHIRVRARRSRLAVRGRRRRPLRRLSEQLGGARCPRSAGRWAWTARCSPWRPRASWRRIRPGCRSSPCRSASRPPALLRRGGRAARGRA
jgi:histidyl-tRNA synthetase